MRNSTKIILTCAGVSFAAAAIAKRTQNNRDLLELTRDALKDWRAGKLPATSAMMALHAFFFPLKLTKTDLAWRDIVIVADRARRREVGNIGGYGGA